MAISFAATLLFSPGYLFTQSMRMHRAAASYPSLLLAQPISLSSFPTDDHLRQIWLRSLMGATVTILMTTASSLISFMENECNNSASSSEETVHDDRAYLGLEPWVIFTFFLETFADLRAEL
ncbi:hypothetical protein C2S53_004180 [Perilla frutescens var. hirtella]|uniref:Uncharacterized protein n=1 Tax=Perilla frutescens var. hirtella TaxID=608512 RepID=A0AAD4PCT1_PERFH|nr:hypothetical protein C2S53_004180 [Perilla frutescens var. hirtella]